MSVSRDPAEVGGADTKPLLLASVFVVASCGLGYELTMGTLASYLLGDSVSHFSFTIGFYLFSMGLGAFAVKWFEGDALGRFVCIELALAALGGASAPALFLLFPYVSHFQVALYGVILLIGALVGAEIPLLLQVLKDKTPFKSLVSEVFGVDYFGALLVALVFPQLLVPRLGLVRTSLFFGIVNALVAVLLCVRLGDALAGRRTFLAASAAILVGLGALWGNAESVQRASEAALLGADVVHAVTTPYQRIALTRQGSDLRLHLNGHLQFSSADEYRYHESLVHPGLSSVPGAARVLVLGGGDGLAVREILRHPGVRSVTLVDLDPAMTSLFRDSDGLARLNGFALRDARVTVRNEDALIHVRESREKYDFVVADFPDPGNYAVGKLYTTEFYRSVARLLAPGGLLAVQATSPLAARRSFWTIEATLRAAGYTTRPYHAFIPSFGEWGFVLAGLSPWEGPASLPAGLRYLTQESLPGMFRFPADMARAEVRPNSLLSQALVQTYGDEWREGAR